MTSLVAWIGVDSRGTASMYFASDSRISWDGSPKVWDCGKKIFATSTSPEIFGFTGYVLLPQRILPKVCNFIDNNIRSKDKELSAQEKVDWLYQFIYSEAINRPTSKDGDFTIFYGQRVGNGMKSKFHLYVFIWTSLKKDLKKISISLPQFSGVLQTSGSGKPNVDNWSAAWQRSEQGSTSRIVFSAFCDSLLAKEDPKSGGEPQLVGLYRKGNSKTFGVFSSNGASYLGKLIPNTQNLEIEWRDRLFQRVNAQGMLLKGAQKHSRPPLTNDGLDKIGVNGKKFWEQNGGKVPTV